MRSLPAFVVPGARCLLAVSLLAACGDASKSDAPGKAGKEQAATGAAVSCASADTTALSLAVRDFIGKAVPTPQRYLHPVGTDSALPDDGFKVLQDKGPTFFYNNDTAAQRKMKTKLANDGPFATMLVVFRGSTSTEGGNAVDVRLGGHYVGGEHDGKLAPTKRYAVRCDSIGWRISSSAEEPGA